MQENQTFNDVVRQNSEIPKKFQTMLHTRNTLRAGHGVLKIADFSKSAENYKLCSTGLETAGPGGFNAGSKSKIHRVVSELQVYEDDPPCTDHPGRPQGAPFSPRAP